MPIPPITLSALLTTPPVIPEPIQPREDPMWVAVEFDLVGPNNNDFMLRIGNRGTLTRVVGGELHEYDPRLTNLPIQLGATITVTGSISVTQYGSPTRTQPNGGTIEFTLDEKVWEFLSYHWIGHKFRVYEGENDDPARADVDADLTQVYAGRIANITYDTKTASIQTTDETIQWDNPLITDFYDPATPVAIRGRPKPYVWGLAYSIKPEIEDEANQIWGVSHRPGGLDQILEVRVGGIPWNLNAAGPPGPGEWTPNLANGTFQLGSPPLSFDVRCDAQQGQFTLAGLLTDIITTAGGELNLNSMRELNVAIPGLAGFATSTSPVNRLNAIDEFMTAAGCWWGVNALGKVVAGVIDTPGTKATLALTKIQTNTIALNTVQPPAWRIRVGYRRNWEPETNFAPAVLQTEQARWGALAPIIEPHFEDNTVLTTEPRAVDVPMLPSSLVVQTDALAVQSRLVRAWGTIRSLFDATAFLRPEDIKLYDTVAVDYMMVTGHFRITSAIRAIGGGPATLQLWGTIGPIAVAPGGNPPPGTPGSWLSNAGGSVGGFTIGVDTPSTVTQLFVRGWGAGGGGGGSFIDSGSLYCGGGGGAGGYFEDTVPVINGDVFDWKIGAGGQGGVAGGFSGGGVGGFTSFAREVSGFEGIALGGAGGNISLGSVAGGLGGTATGAATLITGGPGGDGYIHPLATNVDVFTANGGSNTLGNGGLASTTFEPGGEPGTGGGGHVGTSFIGGMPGNAGQIIVTWVS